jgi:hypothetical protein
MEQGWTRRRTCCQRYVVEQNVEDGCSSSQVIAHQPGNIFSLGDQLAGIELSDHALQDFVDYGGKHPLIVIGSEGAVDLWQGFDPGSRQNTAGDVDHLQVFGSGKRGDIPRSCANVVYDGRLEPRNPEMCT